MKEDDLKYSDYANLLTDIIQQSETPVTIGVFGEWGIGKTSLMRKVESIISQKKCVAVWFDVWKFAREEAVWRMLLLQTLKSLREKIKKEKKTLKMADDLELRLFSDIDEEKKGSVIFHLKKAEDLTGAETSGRIHEIVLPTVTTLSASTEDTIKKVASIESLNAMMQFNLPEWSLENLTIDQIKNHFLMTLSAQTSVEVKQEKWIKTDILNQLMDKDEKILREGFARTKDSACFFHRITYYSLNYKFTNR